MSKIISSGRGIHSSKFYEKRERQKRLRRLIWLGASILLLVALFYIAWSKRFQIQTVVVIGENVSRKEDVKAVAKDFLSGTYSYVLPRKNAFIYPKDGLEQILLRKFPRFASLDLSLEGPNTLVVTPTLRSSYALYCRERAGLGDCYFITDRGLVFDRSPDFAEGVYLVYTTTHYLDEPIGQELLVPEQFVSVSKFVKGLEELDIKGSKLEIGEGEFALSIATGGKIMWKATGDLVVLRSNLELFLNSDAIKAEKNFLERISYLDLRTDNKVFYQFR